ncbi:MAG: hypothetical protein HC904_04095 [Blastochloris sp.]|nr:hypothetical protein [Blastochloris sp.]
MSEAKIFLSPEVLKRLRGGLRTRLQLSAWEELEKMVEVYLSQPEIEYCPGEHNCLLNRARKAQKVFVTLAVHYFLTGQDRSLENALGVLDQVCGWERWSTDAMRAGNASPLADFDLSYGENCTTLALGLNWFSDQFSGVAYERVKAKAVVWGMEPFLHFCQREHRRHWYGRADSNWNTVCTGGAGMLALALKREYSDWHKVIRHTDESFQPYFKLLERTAGGWPEGIGYWNYGMRYAFFYLMASGDVLGSPHPLTRAPGVRETLFFPFDFSPKGIGCSFGDVNTWSPNPFHHAMAARLGLSELQGHIDRALLALPESERWSGPWPKAAEYLLFHPRSPESRTRRVKKVQKRYPEMDWGILADQMPEPMVYASIRGGSTAVPHSHIDIGSFHLVMNGHCVVRNITVEKPHAEYMDTTFSPRRFELAEMRADSKNMILVNGVGVQHPAQAELQPVKVGGKAGFFLDLTQAMGISRDHKPAVVFAGRLFLLLGNQGLLVIDHVKLPFTGRVESRFHTPFAPGLDGTRAHIKAGQTRFTASFASTVPSVLSGGQTTPTLPEPGLHLLRWCTQTREHMQVVHAALFGRGVVRKIHLEIRREALFLDIPGLWLKPHRFMGGLRSFLR